MTSSRDGEHTIKLSTKSMEAKTLSVFQRENDLFLQLLKTLVTWENKRVEACVGRGEIRGIIPPALNNHLQLGHTTNRCSITTRHE
mmetsp:Transcript_17480/g.42705  ORF Transcript_17480/g.42705 Transcript_17480/m.42705 type:complete len:86 (+) Transcript_17480:66-323(+)